jgi:hypothetical protein
MAGAAFGLFFVTLLLWVPAIWLYFDAEERGHSAYLWGALALIPVWNVPVIVAYFIVRSRKQPSSALEYSRARIYQHVAVVTFWGLVAVGVTSVLFGLIRYARADGAARLFEEPRDVVLRATLAFAFALLVVAAPAFAVHFAFMRRRLRRAVDVAAERLAMARLQSGLFSLVLLVSGLLATLSAVTLVFEGSGRLFDVGNVDRDLSTFGMSVLPVALISIGVAFIVFWLAPEFQSGRGLLREAAEADARVAAALAAPPPSSTAAAPATEAPGTEAPAATPAAPAAPSSTADARFCIECGSALPAGARFCPGCGTVAATA